MHHMCVHVCVHVCMCVWVEIHRTCLWMTPSHSAASTAAGDSGISSGSCFYPSAEERCPNSRFNPRAGSAVHPQTANQQPHPPSPPQGQLFDQLASLARRQVAPQLKAAMCRNHIMSRFRDEFMGCLWWLLLQRTNVTIPKPQRRRLVLEGGRGGGSGFNERSREANQFCYMHKHKGEESGPI